MPVTVDDGDDQGCGDAAGIIGMRRTWHGGSPGAGCVMHAYRCEPLPTHGLLLTRH
jgi:hypothetical protein